MSSSPKNHEALRAGYNYVDQHLFKKAIPKFEARTSSYKRVVMSGNEALSIGAISAGCRYYGGYPDHAGLRHFGIHGKRFAEVWRRGRADRR